MEKALKDIAKGLKGIKEELRKLNRYNHRPMQGEMIVDLLRHSPAISPNVTINNPQPGEPGYEELIKDISKEINKSFEISRRELDL